MEISLEVRVGGPEGQAYSGGYNNPKSVDVDSENDVCMA
jgi:hypothetical protein